MADLNSLSVLYGGHHYVNRNTIIAPEDRFNSFYRTSPKLDLNASNLGANPELHFGHVRNSPAPRFRHILIETHRL